MKAWKIIFKILLVVVFVCSVLLNIFLYSCSNKLSADSSFDTRQRLYYTSIANLQEPEEITINNKNYYDSGKTQFVKETISCSLKEEDERVGSFGSDYDCKMVSRLYSSESKDLIRISYFPGDGHKYTYDGTNKTKISYENSLLSAYASSLISGTEVYETYLLGEYYFDADKIKYSGTLNVGFASYTNKIVFDSDYKNSDTSEKIDYYFDFRDRLTKITTGEDMSLEFSYKTQNLEIPDLSDYK